MNGFLTLLILAAPGAAPATENDAGAIRIDSNFPGGNIVLETIRGDDVFVHQDLRDTLGDWFYWYFRVRGAQGRSITFHFTQSRAIGLLGPGVSRDGGRSWQWLGHSDSATSFRYQFAAHESEVRFSFGMPYQEADLLRFLEKQRGSPYWKQETLAQTRNGRAVECLHLGRISANAPFKVLVTCRHHACEMMASYAVGGLMAAVLGDSETGVWLRGHVDLLVVPFVDKDGVELGDQGKNRKPHDHKADYRGESIYPEVAALRALVPKWSNGNPDVTLDMHDPAMNNQVIYTHALRTAGKNAAHARQFLEILEKVQCGPLKFRVQDSLEFAARKRQAQPNDPAGQREKNPNGSPGETPTDDGPCTVGFEMPYAVVRGAEVTPESARAFGHDLARALRVYLGASH